ncbi:voltage gated sodium channel [Hyalella azteca]|uniref:Sodium channel protein n=1 Tax=Hyalella azteca TaxID=294128 RepID=A0A6A0H589_HYAAZ|nr:voltage gated sodium channel [Hyalella azteca]
MFTVISKGKDIFRFSATDALWLLSPFSPLRRTAIYILINPLFNFFIICTILSNCMLMMRPSTEVIEASEVLFTAIYTFESGVKVMARGFILEGFTYLRDAWNWLDFVVIALAYVTMVVIPYLAKPPVLSKIILRSTGLKTIVGAVIESVKNLRDVIILTVFSLSVFALLGLQIYMGVLSQKCIVKFDFSRENWTHEEYFLHNNNSSHWMSSEDDSSFYPLCGNSSGAGQCPRGFLCLQGYGPNPDYGYTSFDSFSWALLSAFRLMTQDYWENLYQQVLRAAGPWHIVFFLFIIFLGSYYLVNLILAIVAMSYDQLQKKAEEEEEAALAEEEAIRVRNIHFIPFEAEEAAEAAMNRATAGHGRPPDDLGGDPGSIAKSPSEFSRVSYEIFVSQRDLDENKEKISLRSEGGESINETKARTKGRKDGSMEPEEALALKLKNPETNPFIDPIQKQTVVDMRDVMVLNDIIEQAAQQHGRLSRASDHGEDEEEPLAAKIKKKVIEYGKRLIEILCVWDCCWLWLKIQHILGLIVFDPFVELFITLCIVVNTLFMAMDHHGMRQSFSDFLKMGNYVSIACISPSTFTIEAFTKLMAMSPKFYFQEGWNIFDFFIVALSLIELGLEGVQGLSVLRSFRLLGIQRTIRVDVQLRVFKLAKSWPTLNLLISIMGKTVGALGNLTFVLCIIIFIFAVMGMQLFGKNYTEKVTKFKWSQDGQMPRWNFVDFFHSFMIVFRVLCGEWIESMWDCMYVGDFSCVPFFLATVVIGNLVVLNLFLALLLSSFGASNLSAPTGDGEPNKIAEAFDRIARFKAWVKRSIMNFLKGIRAKITNQIRDHTPDESVGDDARGLTRDAANVVSSAAAMNNRKIPNMADVTTVDIPMDGLDLADGKLKQTLATINNRCGHIGNSINNRDFLENDYTSTAKIMRRDDDDMSDASLGSHRNRKLMSDSCSHRGSTESLEDEAKKTASKDDLDDDFDASGEEEEEEYDEEGEPQEVRPVMDTGSEEVMDYPSDCFKESFYVRFPMFAGDPDSPFWQGWAHLRYKTYLLIENKYFETAVITMILMSSLALAVEDVNLAHKPALIDVLYYMDRIFTVIFFIEMAIKFVALGFAKYFTNAWCWLDFLIVMVSLINLIATLAGAGKIQAFKTMRTLRALRPLRAMSRMQGMRVVVNALIGAIPSIVNVLLVCLIFWLIFAIMGCMHPDGYRWSQEDIPDMKSCKAGNYSWENSEVHFDHVPMAYLALFQVATWKGWIPIMNDAIDTNGLNNQPIREVNLYMYFYFVFFIIFGSFFTLNLFIGVIIDNFNEQKKKMRGSLEMFMTDDQKKYYNAMKKMGGKKPLKAIPRPQFKPQAVVFEIVTSKKFDMIIMLFIGVNMLTMTLDHYQMSPTWTSILDSLNLIFICIFSSECFLKVFALRWHYFKEPWNLFDFVVVIMSILGLVLSDLIEKYFVSPTLLRVVRVAKVGRVLRLVKGAKGIRTLLFALAMSLPALFNICLLLFLVMFIFAIFGMSFFMNVKHTGALDSVYSFETFFQSFILLFQMMTSAGWDGVLSGLMNEKECDPPVPELGLSGNCGNQTFGIAFILSYLVISFLIVINMYIAVILENYSQATEDVEEGLTGDDYDMYYEIWQQFDPKGTQFVQFSQLSDFLDVLEPPLQIHKPNKYKIVSMDIPICKGDMVFCVDILDALTKDFFARKGSPVEESVDMGEVAPAVDRPGYEPVSSTLWRQREEYCARLIQQAWRRHRQNKDQSSLSGGGSHEELKQADTAVLVESDGHVTKNGHKVVIHSRSPSLTSRSTDV